MTNKIKRLISILLVTVLFLLTIQPAFATGNKRKIDDYSIEELLNLSVQEQENLGFYVLAEVPMRIPVSNTDGSRVVSYIDGTWRVLYTKANGLGFYMSGTTVGIGPDLIKNVSGTDYYTSYSDNIERSCPFSTTALVPEQSIYNTTYTYDYIIQPIHMTSMMLELILIAALGVILEWLAQANQSIGVQLHKLPSRNYDFDQLWMKLFLNPVMSIC